ncbi:hypothetical protein LX36DRAFT_67987 [Colletotrichum falcatum]|nr:hypothetical protein LX36DRAFT_67987 [Colletotrichum falcatum]
MRDWGGGDGVTHAAPPGSQPHARRPLIPDGAHTFRRTTAAAAEAASRGIARVSQGGRARRVWLRASPFQPGGKRDPWARGSLPVLGWVVSFWVCEPPPQGRRDGGSDEGAGGWRTGESSDGRGGASAKGEETTRD